METAMKPTMKKGSTTYKIIIPDKVERLIRFLCERVWDTEWSGVLFYTPTGNFEDGSLEIHCEDIFPMDIGSTTYTEFNMSPDVISYMAQKPELLDCKMGLIHSHNNMSTFFSGTDMNTLQEEGDERNHFVSLIVNNAGKYSAAITRKIKYTSVRNVSYEGFNGTVNSGQETVDGEEIEYFTLEIVFETPQENGMKEVADRLTEIKEAKKKAAPAHSPYTSSYNTYLNKDLTTYKSPQQPTLFDDDEYVYRGSGFGSTPVVQEVKSYNKYKDLVSAIVAQLLSGNVTCTSLNGANKDKVVDTMEKRFNNRFGNSDEGMLLFEYWATDFIEFLTWYSIDDTKEDAVSPEQLACDIIDELKDLPENKYIKKYIELLVGYEEKF